MPSYATAQWNSSVRRAQLAGEHIDPYGPDAPVAAVDNPASPAEFPDTREEFGAPIPEFTSRAARHAAPEPETTEVDDPETPVPATEPETAVQ